MQPVKLSIEGDFWDSHLYSGKLYLFSNDGELITVNWDKLINELLVDEDIKFALDCAFFDSSLLYNSRSWPIVHESEIKNIIVNKFKKLSTKELVVSEEHLKRFIIGVQDSPFRFPHSDLCIYGKKMFVGSKEGLFSASCDGKTKKPVSSRINKGWDGPISSISASYNKIAIAAGSEGVLEKDLSGSSYTFSNHEPSLILEGNFNLCNWLYFSIYGSSNTNGGLLADFHETEEVSNERQFLINSKNKVRKLREVISEEKLFSSGSGYSWGNHDKIFKVNDNRISILKYNPWSKDNRLHKIDEIELYAWKGKVISASTALFGSVIECENAIVVLPTEGAPITFAGEPVNWRTFSRSKNYENQLHIIYDDKIDIYSFNHDYFTNQDQKIYGIQKSFKNS